MIIGKKKEPQKEGNNSTEWGYPIVKSYKYLGMYMTEDMSIEKQI